MLISKVPQLANTVCFLHRVQCSIHLTGPCSGESPYLVWLRRTLHKATPFSHCAKQRHIVLAGTLWPEQQPLRFHCLNPDLSKMANNFITWTPGFFSNIVEEFHLQSTRFHCIASYKVLHRPGEELSPSFHSVRKPMLRKGEGVAWEFKFKQVSPSV